MRRPLALVAVLATLPLAPATEADSSRSRPAPAVRAPTERPPIGWRTDAARPAAPVAPRLPLSIHPYHLHPVGHGTRGYGVEIGFAPPPSAPVDPRRIRVGPPAPPPRPLVVVVERRGAVAEERVRVPPPPPAPAPQQGAGEVWLSIAPPEARVRLDGLPLGAAETLDDEPLTLASGVHVLEARAADGGVERLVFSIEPEQMLLLEMDLGAEDPRDRSRWISRRDLPRGPDGTPSGRSSGD